MAKTPADNYARRWRLEAERLRPLEDAHVELAIQGVKEYLSALGAPSRGALSVEARCRVGGYAITRTDNAGKQRSHHVLDKRCDSQAF